MKKLNAYNKKTACGLALVIMIASLFAVGFAQDAAQELQDGITWNTTVAQMKEIEGITEEEEFNAYMSGELFQYGFMRESGNETLDFFLYSFKADQLVMYGCSTDAYYQPEGTDMQEIFAVQLAKFTGKYGEPTLEGKQQLLALFAALGQGALTEELITGFAGWELLDGTVLYLINISDQSVIYLYANMMEIQGERE